MLEFRRKRIAQLTPLAERGDAAAMCRLSEEYANAWGDNISEQEHIVYASKALYWLKRSAEAGFYYAAFELANMYENPLGDIRYRIFRPDPELARKYRALAEKLRKK